MQRQTMAALLTSFALTAAASSAFASARAELQPANGLVAGVPGRLSITTDRSDRPPAPPQITGATIRLSGQMTESSSINGAVTNSNTFVYTIVADHAGSLDIPAIAVGGDTTEPIHATVATGSATATTPPASAESSHAFLTMDMPAHALVVGQVAPIKIHAYFRGGTSASLEGAPHVTSNAFTLANLSDKPAQAQVELRGEPYLEATWTAQLSPMKPTTAKLVVELPVELAYRDAPQRRAPTADPFDSMVGDDPFADMDSMFDVGPMQRRNVTLRATSGVLAVAELPTQGQPAGFAGAVGHFDLAADPLAGEPRVGEPLTITAHVTGSGNFDRVAMDGVPEAAELHTYPAKGMFSAATNTKTFTQTVVPTRAGDVVIPALVLAYYDPTTHAYRSSATAPVTLHVAAAIGGTADPGLAARAQVAAPLHISTEATHSTLQPLIRQAWFWWLPASIIAMTALLVAIAWWQRSPRIAQVLHARRIDRAVARAEAAMDRAARDGNRAEFFGAARTALQTRLAGTWQIAPEAITAHDVNDRLGSEGASIRAVLERADGLDYGRPTLPDEPLEHWNTIVHTELSHLETL